MVAGLKLPNYAQFLELLRLFDTVNNVLSLKSARVHSWVNPRRLTYREKLSTRFCCKRRQEIREGKGRKALKGKERNGTQSRT